MLYNVGPLYVSGLVVAVTIGVILGVVFGIAMLVTVFVYRRR